MPFRRRKQVQGDVPPGSPMVALRLQALNLDASDGGFRPTEDLPRVFGAVLDMAYDNGVATVVSFADGTTSLYTTGGFGIIGVGTHEAVARAGAAFLASLESHLDALGLGGTTDVPQPGWVAIHALMFEGRRRAEAPEDLGRGRHPLSPVFSAVQDVITQLRLIDERRQGREA